MNTKTRLGLFAGFGIELEYAIVDRTTLDVRPLSHLLLQNSLGEIVSDVEREGLAWSNELTHHVIELKTSTPVPTLEGLANRFQDEVTEINRRLAEANAILLPSAMHPWMNPDTETHLWPYEYSEIYAIYDRVFNCQGHGWSNLQSMHLNLPFSNDEEFGRLHAAIRIALPLLPAIAASSPWRDGRRCGVLDGRLEVYCQNSRRIPSLLGNVIPEPVFTEQQYHDQIFAPMYRDIAPLDPDGILQDEFLNSRGAIARFGRGSIEIRVLDVQECPQADIAIAGLTIAVLRCLCNEDWSTCATQQKMETVPLRQIFDQAVRDGEEAVIDNAQFLTMFDLPSQPITLGAVWSHLIEKCSDSIEESAPVSIQALKLIQQQGPLARRMIAAARDTPDLAGLKTLAEELTHCLATGTMLQTPSAKL